MTELSQFLTSALYGLVLLIGISTLPLNFMVLSKFGTIYSQGFA